MKDQDRFYLRQARNIAEDCSKDPSTRVGAYIARANGKPVSFGYNGFPSGCDDDPKLYADRATKYRRTVHAEANAIVTARQDVSGCTLYTWPFQPCSHCAGLAIQAGIARVVSLRCDNPRWAESFEEARNLFAEAGVALDLLEPEALA